MDSNVDTYPVNGLLPKRETEAYAFLTKYPEYDGRGTIIAVLDTGVDPGAPGLQQTSDSKVKIIDLIDATGAGDVDISTIREVNDEGILIGLSERKLKIPKTWSNPSGKYHLGIKSVFELYSSNLKDRVRKERKEKLWTERHERALSVAQKRINDYNATVTDADKNNLDKTIVKEDLQSQYDVIKDLEKKVNDTGPVYDCLVWKNEDDVWYCCIDTSECGDMEKCEVLANYKDCHRYGTFTHLDMLNYTVRITPDDNLLQIVTDSGSHGTHVAAIASAFHKDSPELNGVAPGAQILSIKIGDSRLSGMETGYAFVNALKYIIEYKCHLVNVSFGEPVSYCSQGPVLTGFAELVEKYGVVVCMSAGNNGPGVETVNAPGAYANHVLSIGAYVTNDMIKSDYALLANSPTRSMLFTWTSRGPSIDGATAVNFCAPGGAITSIPNWTLGCRQLMNGTSMSSPNCCGSIALVLSALIANGVEYFPFGVQRALENTCIPIPEDPYGSGSGLIQVDKAYELLRQYEGDITNKLTFTFKCGPKSLRGVYIKTADECIQPKDFQIFIEPTFASSDFLDENKFFKSQLDKISFDLKVALVCEESWVQCPQYINLTNQTRQFFIRVKANELEPGSCYRTYIKGYNCEDKLKLLLFKIPITVIKPYVFNESNNTTGNYEITFNKVVFRQGQIFRHFVTVPYGATHAEITLDCKQNQPTRDHSPLFYIQTTQFEKYRSYADSEDDSIYRLNILDNFKYSFKCKSNKVIQICVCKNWSNVGEVSTDYKIKFYGLYPNTTQSIHCISSEPKRIDITCLQDTETCEPTISYKHQLMPLRPTESQIEIYRQRDGSIRSIYQMILTYTFHQTKSAEVGCEVPLLSNYLYENEYQSIFWMLFETSTKRFIVCGDAFPLKYKYGKTIDKGDYTVKLFIRHEKFESLEKLKQTVLYVRQSISGVQQDIFNSYESVLKGSKRSTNGSGDKLFRNQQYTYYLDTINDDKLPKQMEKGHLLRGEICFYKDSDKSKVDKHEIIYQLVDLPNKKLATTNNDKSSTKTEEEKLNDAVRDLKVSFVLKSNQVFDTLKEEYSDYIPLYVNRVKYLEQQVSPKLQSGTALKDEELKEVKEKCEQIIDICKFALGKINQNEILAYFGAKKQLDASNDETKKF